MVKNFLHTEGRGLPRVALAVLLLLVTLAGCRKPPVATGSSLTSNGIAISDAVAWGLASAKSSSMGFVVTCAAADTLQGVESPDGSASLHASENSGMTTVSGIPCEPGKQLTLRGGGFHIMLTEVTHGFAMGDSVVVNLRWARAGVLRLAVPIVRYSDAQDLLNR